MQSSKLAIAFLFLSLTGCQVSSLSANPDSNIGNTANAQTSAASSSTALPDAAGYGDVLDRHVNEKNLVNYAALQGDRQALDRYNDALATVDPAVYATWSEAEQITFWVNAYNSLTLASIINQAPLKSSIKDIPGVWKREQHPILSGTKTLDNIEHDTLRVNFNEPRIHAALVCAAISCPPLRNEPYTAERLDEQLDDQVRQWLANPSAGLKIDRNAGTVSISSIFKWFGEDWVPSYGVDSGFTGNDKQRAVLNFISSYVSPEDKAYLEAGDYKVKYLKYDWALNAQS